MSEFRYFTHNKFGYRYRALANGGLGGHCWRKDQWGPPQPYTLDMFVNHMLDPYTETDESGQPLPESSGELKALLAETKPLSDEETEQLRAGVEKALDEIAAESSPAPESSHALQGGLDAASDPASSGAGEPAPVRGAALPALKPAYHAPIYKTGLATWQYKQPCDWSENRSVSRWLLGPCPRCGSITKTYGGGYSCCNDACPNSASRFVTCTDDPAPEWWGSDVQVFKDRNAWCAVDGVTFVNLQESPAGFGDTPNAAVKALEKAWQADAEKTFAEGKTPEKLALPTLPAPAPPSQSRILDLNRQPGTPLHQWHDQEAARREAERRERLSAENSTVSTPPAGSDDEESNSPRCDQLAREQDQHENYARGPWKTLAYVLEGELSNLRKYRTTPPAEGETPLTEAPPSASEALAYWYEAGGIEPIADDLAFLAEQLFSRCGHLRGSEAGEEVTEADGDHPWTAIEGLLWKAGYEFGIGKMMDAVDERITVETLKRWEDSLDLATLHLPPGEIFDVLSSIHEEIHGVAAGETEVEVGASAPTETPGDPRWAAFDYNYMRWHRLSQITWKGQVTELLAASSCDGIGVIARWTIQPEGTYKVEAMDTENGEWHPVTEESEEEPVPLLPPPIWSDELERANQGLARRPQFEWVDATQSKPPQGERVLLAIRDEDNPVVGYWGAAMWEVCTCNIQADSELAGIEEAFQQEDVTDYARIGSLMDLKTAAAGGEEGA